MTTKTAIIVPNWNGEEFLKRCLDSLLNQSVNCSIIVVDNGSKDSSLEILAKYQKKIIVLRQEENLGFAGGVNVGLKYALSNNFTYAALFNNDAIADKNWLEQLLSTAKKSKAGIVTGKFLRADNKTIDSTGDFYTIWGLPFPRGRNTLDTGQYDQTEPVFGASGGASLYDISMLEDIGLFDEHFFAYYEDVDISFRAQLAGYRVMYSPKALAYHNVGGTSSKLGDFTIYHSAKNFWLLYLKNMPGFLYFKYLPLASFWYVRIFIGRIVRGGLLAFIKGWLKSILLLPKTLLARHKIQKKRHVSISYIDSILIKSRPSRPPHYSQADNTATNFK